MSEVVIIGAGECGVRAAFALRERGYAGSVTIIGEEAELPYERPPLSKNTVVQIRHIRARDDFDTLAIELRLGLRVDSIDREDRTVRLADGQRLAYDKLLIATGARAKLPDAFERCLTLRTSADARAVFPRIRRGARIAMIGGGFIGLELAAMARAAGAEVTVYEMGPRLLGRAVPAEIAQVVQDRHLAEGVEIHTSADVIRADDKTLALSDGRKIAFDAVFAAMGAAANTGLAEAAGLEVENGIVVDDRFCTSDPAIHAAGDCCAFPWQGARVRLESWKAAQDQGAHAAAAMLGASEAYASVPWFWSDQYDLTLQVAGLFDPSLPTLARAAETGVTIVFQCDTSGRPVAAAGIGPGNAAAKDIRIFEKLIQRGESLDPSVLSDPAQNLKRLLRAA